MNCFYHPEKNAIGVCQVCGRGLCQDCQNIRYGRILCSSCLKEAPPGWFDFRLGFLDLSKAFREFLHLTYPCPKCGKPIKHEFNICPYCQTKLRTECSNCGRMMEPGWVACPYCGEKSREEKK